jgi:hypothetical protein
MLMFRIRCCGGLDDLTETDSVIVGRYPLGQKDFETALLQKDYRLSGRNAIVKHAPGQTHPIDAVSIR